MADGLDALPVGTVVRERYRIVAVVGRGGLGTVYQVTDIIFGKQNVFALKELLDQSSGARKQFELESQWLQSLDHNHIPKVREHFRWANRLYLVMDFVDGENLDQKLMRHSGRPLPEQQLLGWTFPICDALHYLHTRMPPILHRDVKPANIIVTPAGYPVLVDLGIAKEHLPGADQTLTFVRKAGTEGYAPPEQYATGGQTGPWSDVYGLGATLYHLLTGRVPPTAVERVALDQHLIHPRTINPAVSSSVDAAICQALALRPADRFQTMIEFARALNAPTSAPSYAPRSAPPTPAPASQPPRSQPTPPAFQRVQPSFGTDQLPSLSPTPPRPPSALGSRPSAPPSGRLRPSEAPALMPVTAAVTRASTDFGSLPTEQTDVTERTTFPTAARKRRRIILSVGVASIVLVAIALGIVLVSSATPPDRSTPAATVNGYFAALAAQDYNRAWLYSASSRNNVSSKADFIANLRSDDVLLGQVTHATIRQSSEDSTGKVTVIADVTRTGSGSVVSYTLNLSQYDGSTWLINNITSS
ncbi:MAG: hypothetical protein OJF49_001431 [Ktedonobacterales bacterium]|jgi:serine/threonine-protein kinase|nr:MAG: hypothetical protein OJF49_001431 [Ktedonobacterales bacterium]